MAAPTIPSRTCTAIELQTISGIRLSSPLASHSARNFVVARPRPKSIRLKYPNTTQMIPKSPNRSGPRPLTIYGIRAIPANNGKVCPTRLKNTFRARLAPLIVDLENSFSGTKSLKLVFPPRFRLPFPDSPSTAQTSILHGKCCPDSRPSCPNVRGFVHLTGCAFRFEKSGSCRRAV